jgi:hypothetical protein
MVIIAGELEMRLDARCGNIRRMARETRMITGISLALSLVWSADLSAQVAGQVRTDDGSALPGAEVVFWGGGQVLAEDVTDPAGRFEVALEPAEVRRISVHYVGFGTEIVAGEQLSGDPLDIRLSALPISLPEVAVLLTRDICNEPEDPAARALWESARQSYQKDTGVRGGLAWGRGLETDVRGDRLGDYGDSRLVGWGRGWGMWPSGEGRIRPSLEESVVEFGYAWRPGLSTSGTERRHLNWSYPEFEQRHAYHFVTDTFGARHTFHLLEEGSSEIAFCPIERSQAWLQGRLSLGADGSFVSLRWAVRTSDPQEGAGGEVLFMDAHDVAGGRHLVSGRGVFWRHDGRKPLYPDVPRDYYQLILVNSGWKISTNEIRPDCAARTCSGG